MKERRKSKSRPGLTPKAIRRIVVKVGTHCLVQANGHLNRRRIAALVDDLVALKRGGHEVILISSGAIGAGLQALGVKQRPKALHDLQMAAAVGQTQLLHCYHDLFKRHRCVISQVLLTHADLNNRVRHLNARNTMSNLLRHGIIPIVNENDVVAVDEIKVGDNDILSALVTVLIDADLLILLTTPNGLRKPMTNNKTARVPIIDKIDESIFRLVTKKQNALSVGGMSTKLKAAQIANEVGAQTVIASGRQTDVLQAILRGEDVGTLIGSKERERNLRKRKRWLSYFHRSEGRIVVDAGAQTALQKQGKSLLPAGIKSVEGTFTEGALVDIVNTKNESIGQGLVGYNSAAIDTIKGHKSTEIAKLLGFKDYDEVIHRDNMVVTT